MLTYAASPFRRKAVVKSRRRAPHGSALRSTPRSHSNRCRESSALSKAGWSTILAGLENLGRRCSSTFCWRLKAGSPSRTTARAGELRCAFVAAVSSASGSPSSANLDRLPAERGEQEVDREGCLDTPAAKGSHSGALGRSPSLSSGRACFGGRASVRAGSPAAHRAKLRPGCGSPRRGFAAHAALGRRAPLGAA